MKKAIFLTLGISYLYAFLVAPTWLTIGFYMVIPGLVALSLAIYDKEPIAIFPSGGIWKTLKLLFKTTLIPVMITLCVSVVNLCFSKFQIDANLLKTVQHNGAFSPLKFSQVIAVFSLILIGLTFTFNALLALGEELMWRGYLLNKLKHFPLWKQSIAIGAIWGLWQAPLTLFFHQNYPQAPFVGIFLMIFICMLLSPIMIRMTRTHGAIGPATIFSSSLSTIGGLSLIVFPNSNLLYTGVTGLSGLIVLIGLNLLIYRKARVTA